MSAAFLVPGDLPFCPGCGHHSAARNTERALQSLGLSPLDVVLVTDIGCHGIIDKQFLTHTVHGLHGRSVALAGGIAMETSPAKKVIVFIGDGGVSIGINHLLLAAARNFDMTVVVLNNFLYGMTGGQPSSLTPRGYKTATEPAGRELAPLDVCSLMHEAGAALVHRVAGRGDYSPALAEAFATRGFSLVEIMELCPSYGGKLNPGLKVEAIAEAAGLAFEKKLRADAQVFAAGRCARPSLFDDLAPVPVSAAAALGGQARILLSGSAGEGVQTAAELFARAAMTAGLQATKKGSYPVTVGVGFSAAEIVISKGPILYHGLGVPDYVLVTSADGLSYARGLLSSLRTGEVLLDSSLETATSGAALSSLGFRAAAGPRQAALAALVTLLARAPLFPQERFLHEIKAAFGGKVDEAKLRAVK